MVVQLLTILSLLSAGSFAFEAPSEEPFVCAYEAGCLRGKHMPGYQTKTFEAFLGIPYAQPPVGDLRFSSPKSYPRWRGILNATAAKADCIQKNYLMPDPAVYGEEDCLYLNVYRPAVREKSLPVMVYIHGGGWFSGSASPELHGPEYFMDTKEVILVTFAYRLGAMGFLSTDDVHMPGNFGLKDQNLALRWVQRNIAAFGGNAKMVTIFGQSAGGVSAHLHMLSKQSEGLFRNMIILSGTANVPFAITDDPLEQTRQTAALCNISNAYDLSTAKLTRALRNVNAEVLVRSGDGLKYWHVDPMTNFRPVVEKTGPSDAFLTEHPKRLLAAGTYKPVPWMVGLVPHEGAVRVLSILENEVLRNDFNKNFDVLLEKLMDMPQNFNRTQLDEKMAAIKAEYFGDQHEVNNSTAQGFLDTVSDRGFYHPFYNGIRDYVHTINTKKYPVHLYLFNYTGPYTYSDIYIGRHSSRNYGVVHCDDLIYLFRSPMLFPDFARNSTHAAVVNAFVGNFVHFAKYSKPQSSEEYEPCNRASFSREPNTICDYQHFMNAEEDSFAVNIANEFKVGRMELWNEILKGEHIRPIKDR